MPEALPAPPAPGSTLVGTRLLEDWIRAQPHATPAAAALAAECGLGGHQNVCHWYGKRAKRPAPKYWITIERVCGISPAAWETWELIGSCEPPAPESGTRAVDLPELTGSPAERLRTLESWLEGRTRSGHGLPLELSRSVGAMRDAIREQRSQKPIPDLHDHPDWDAVITLILGAVAKYPGAARSIIDAIRASIPDEKDQAA